MIVDIIQKIRDLIEDNLRTDGIYSDTYSTSKIFKLPDPNIVSSSIVVEKNGSVWADSNYSYSSTTGKLTVTGSLSVGDSLVVTYSYYSKYSDTELRGRIRAAAVYIATEEYRTFTVKDTEEIFPTPTEKEESLFALVSGILINPNYSSYKTPDLSITFPNNKSKEQKIKEVVNKYKKAYGYFGYISPDDVIESEVEGE